MTTSTARALDDIWCRYIMRRITRLDAVTHMGGHGITADIAQILLDAHEMPSLNRALVKA